MKLFSLQLKSGKDIVRVLASLGFIFSGILHFRSPDTYIKIMPPSLPSPEGLVYISGFFEIVGGLGLLLFAPATKLRRLNTYGLVALLVAVFPANIYHAFANVQLGGLLNSRVYQWVRLPFQAVFIWGILWLNNNSKS